MMVIKEMKSITRDLIYEVKRIFNMTKNNKDEEIERLLLLLDEKQISELENNNKYLEYVKKNFQYTSEDDQDEKSEESEESEETEERENIVIKIYYEIFLKNRKNLM